MKDIYKFDHCESCGIFRTYHINRKCPIYKVELQWQNTDIFKGREISDEEWKSHESTV